MSTPPRPTRRQVLSSVVGRQRGPLPVPKAQTGSPNSRLVQHEADRIAKSSQLMQDWYDTLRGFPDQTSKSLVAWHDSNTYVADPMLVLEAHLNTKNLNLITLFKILKSDGSAFIDKSKLRKGVKNNKIQLDQMQQEEVIKRVGKKGKISFQDLKDHLQHTRERLQALDRKLRDAGLGKHLTLAVLPGSDLSAREKANDATDLESEPLPLPPTDTTTTQEEQLVIDQSMLDSTEKATLLFDYIAKGDNTVPTEKVYHLLAGLNLFEDEKRKYAAQAFMKSIQKLEDDDYEITRENFVNLAGEPVFRELFLDSDDTPMEDDIVTVFRVYAGSEGSLKMNKIGVPFLKALGCGHEILESTAAHLARCARDAGDTGLTESVLRAAFRRGELDKVVYPPEDLSELVTPSSILEAPSVAQMRRRSSELMRETDDASLSLNCKADPWKRVQHSYNKASRKKRHSFPAMLPGTSLAPVIEDDDGSSGVSSSSGAYSNISRGLSQQRSAPSQSSSIADIVDEFNIDEPTMRKMEAALEKYKKRMKHMKVKTGHASVSPEEAEELAKNAERLRRQYIETEILRDSNGRRELTREDFINLMDNPMLNERVPGFKSYEFLYFLFDAIDANHDEVLTLDECYNAFEKIVDDSNSYIKALDTESTDFQIQCYIAMRNEIDRLHDETSRKIQKLEEDLHEQEHESQKQMENYNHVVKEFDDKMDEYEKQDKDKNTENQRLRDENKKLSVHSAELQEALTAAEKHAQAASRVDSGHDKQLQQMQDKLDELEKAKEDLETSAFETENKLVEQNQTLTTDNTGLAKHSEDLQKSLAEQVDKIEQLKLELSNEKYDAESLRQQVDDLKAEAAEFKNQAQSDADRLKSLKDEMDSLQSSLQQQDDEIAKLVRNLEQLQKDKELDREEAEDKLRKKQEELDAVEQELLNARNIMSASELGSAAERAALEEARIDLENRYKTIDAKQKRDIRDLTDRILGLEADLRKLKLENTSAARELEAQKQANDMDKSLNGSKHLNLVEELDAKEKQITDLLKALADARLKAEDEATEAESKARKLKKSINDLLKEKQDRLGDIENLNINLKKYQTEVDDLKRQLEKSLSDQSGLETKNKELSNEISIVEKENERLIKKSKELDLNNTQLRNEAADTAKQLVMLTDNASAMNDTIQSLKKHVETLSSDKEELAGVNSDLSRERDDIIEKLRERESEIESLRTKLEEATSAIAALKSFENESRQNQAMIAEYKKVLHAKNDSYENLRRNYTRLEIEFDKMRSICAALRRAFDEKLELAKAAQYPSTFSWIGREVYKAFKTPGSFLRQQNNGFIESDEPINVLMLPKADQPRQPALLYVTETTIELHSAIGGGADAFIRFGTWPIDNIQCYAIREKVVTLQINSQVYTFEVITTK